jgi:predicted Zn-dependent peptidase
MYIKKLSNKKKEKRNHAEILDQVVEVPSENIRRLTRTDLTDYLYRHYKDHWMVLTAAGGVERQMLLDLAQKHFSSVSQVY